MSNYNIKSLKDLNGFRSAIVLEVQQSKKLLTELINHMQDADWFTVGIMAPSSELALFTLREMECRFDWKAMHIKEKPTDDGPVFLKANQKTGDIYIRIEYGLGEGILLSCQHEEKDKESDTYGPFPLDFFESKS